MLENIECGLKQLIYEINNNGVKINFNTEFNKDLGFDSLDYIEFITAVEEKYNIDILSEEVERLITFGSLTQYIQTRILPVTYKDSD